MSSGAEGASFEMYPVIQGDIMDVLRRWYNNDLDNIGEPDSSVRQIQPRYTPAHRQIRVVRSAVGSSCNCVNTSARARKADSRPGRLFKLMSSQGGIRVPFIMRFPLLNATFPPGSISHTFGTCMDIMPTFMDLAGAVHPATRDAMWKGQKVIPMNGVSWVPFLRGGSSEVHDQDVMVGWELHGRAAFRKGDWKILYLRAFRPARARRGACIGASG